MWPGEQQPGGQPPGGQQNPQRNPQWQQQPPADYQQPSPYGSPPPQGSPYGSPPPPQPSSQSPYQPGYQQQPQVWGPPVQGGPAGAGGPTPPGNRNALMIAVSVVAAVAVVAAAVIGGVYLMGDDKGGDVADPTTSPRPSATATSTAPQPSATSTPGGGFTDAPRGMPGDIAVKPVVPGWQTQARSDRNVAFDVPKGWKLESPGMMFGYTDGQDKTLTTMSSPAVYKEDWCGHSSRASAGTRGAHGAKSLADEAYNVAGLLAQGAYDENRKGTIKVTTGKAFTNAQGLHGYTSTATVTNIPKGDRCSPSSAVTRTFAYLGSDNEPVVWLICADRGFPGAVSDETIDTMMNSIRPMAKR